jgi:hypothetical protein
MIGFTIKDEIGWQAGAYFAVSADFEDEPNIIEMREQCVAILNEWA